MTGFFGLVVRGRINKQIAHEPGTTESGIELRQQLKAPSVSLPVIYIIGNDSHATRRRDSSGCVAYPTKPFRVQSLIEPIEKGVGRHA